MGNVGILVAFISGVCALGVGVVAVLGPMQGSVGSASVSYTQAGYASDAVPTVSLGNEQLLSTALLASSTVADEVPSPHVVQISQPVEGGDWYVSCPFPGRINRTIVDFTNQGTVPVHQLLRRANGTYAEAVIERAADVSAGTYAVRLASYHTGSTTGTQYTEWWHTVLRDMHGKTVAESAHTRDLDDTELLAMELVTKTLAVPSAAVTVSAVHTAYPNAQPNAVSPLCVAFDRLPESPASSSPHTALRVIEATSSTEWEGYRTCPISPKEKRIIVDFTRQGTVPLRELVVTGDVPMHAATTLLPATIPEGVYEVRLASYGGSATAQVGEHDGWHARVYGADGAVVSTTKPVSDVPEWESEFVKKVQTDFSVPRAGTRIQGVHAAFPSTHADPVAIICAAFDPLPSSTTPTTSVSVTLPSRASTTDGTTESLVTVSPSTVGVPSALRDIAVHPLVVSARRVWANTLPEGSFTALAHAGVMERTRILSMVASGTPALSRMSEEVVRTYSDTEYAERAVREEAVQSRDGVDALRDTDGDGITDYDEKYIYSTNPDNPFTAQGVLTDGERVLLGLNPANTTLVPIVTESPKMTGPLSPEIARVDTVQIATTSQASTTSSSLTIVGTTKPFMFVTLFLYSNPSIVTVRADEQGHYAYSFDEPIPDGVHELYSVVLNGEGDILAKSTPTVFTKMAGVIVMDAVSTEDTDAAQPALKGSLRYVLTLGLLTCVLLAIGGVCWIGKKEEYAIHE
jgi:hypothetical protein